MTYNSTQEIPLFLGAPHKQSLIVAANITSGSLAIQFKVGTGWVTAETFTTSFVKEVLCNGAPIRCLVTGTVEYDVY